MNELKVKKLDLGGRNLSDLTDAKEVKLVYNSLRATFGYPVELCNFKIEDIPHDSVVVTPSISSDYVTIQVANEFVINASENSIEIADMPDTPGGETKVYLHYITLTNTDSTMTFYITELTNVKDKLVSMETLYLYFWKKILKVGSTATKVVNVDGFFVENGSNEYHPIACLQIRGSDVLNFRSGTVDATADVVVKDTVVEL